jgi:hypothetical protein
MAVGHLAVAHQVETGGGQRAFEALGLEAHKVKSLSKKEDLLFIGAFSSRRWNVSNQMANRLKKI